MVPVQTVRKTGFGAVVLMVTTATAVPMVIARL
jgi:hypothetical protein